MEYNYYSIKNRFSSNLAQRLGMMKIVIFQNIGPWYAISEEGNIGNLKLLRQDECMLERCSNHHWDFSNVSNFVFDHFPAPGKLPKLRLKLWPFSKLFDLLVAMEVSVQAKFSYTQKENFPSARYPKPRSTWERGGMVRGGPFETFQSFCWSRHSYCLEFWTRF